MSASAQHVALNFTTDTGGLTHICRTCCRPWAVSFCGLRWDDLSHERSTGQEDCVVCCSLNASTPSCERCGSFAG